MDGKSIWERRGELERDERKQRQVWLDRYYDTPEYKQYREDKQALHEECEANGHVFGSFHDNGFGWTWSYCSQCGGRYDIEKYSLDNDEVVDDDQE